ncbi:MAG: hypothetical protein ACE5NP_03100 [Anaerolineae bacterium]
MTVLGIILALVGYWGPWVDHKAASLVLIGLDLAEFVKFMPQVREGSERVVRELFYLPPLAAAIGLTLVAASRRSIASRPWVRVFLIVVAAVLAFSILPPFPYHLPTMLSSEFRWQTALAVLGLLIVAAYPLLLRLSKRTQDRVLIGLSLLGALPAVAQFFSMKDALDQVYSRSVRVGWGVWITLLGFGIVLAANAWWLKRGEKDEIDEENGPSGDRVSFRGVGPSPGSGESGAGGHPSGDWGTRFRHTGPHRAGGR